MKYNEKEILVFDNIEKIIDHAVEKWIEVAEQSVKEKEIFTAALSGGRTPVLLHKALSEKKGLPWYRTHIFIVDERFVPFDHEDSNFLMIQNTLLKHVLIPSENIHPVQTENSTPVLSAEKYEKEMLSFFNISENEFPRFDLILLGIGEDGHTASLFPGTPVLNETRHLAAAVTQSVKPGKERVTLTFPAINNAKNIILMATGGDKAAAIREVIEEDSSLPAAMVRPERGKLLFLLDKDAASLLSR
ncbi:MAG: 6-phosphogluconolactonase [Nitrospirota bacterium]